MAATPPLPGAFERDASRETSLALATGSLDIISTGRSYRSAEKGREQQETHRELERVRTHVFLVPWGFRRADGAVAGEGAPVPLESIGGWREAGKGSR
jgi:hypothetical protein